MDLSSGTKTPRALRRLDRTITLHPVRARLQMNLLLVQFARNKVPQPSSFKVRKCCERQVVDPMKTPSIVPALDEDTAFIVVDDLGEHGRIFSETKIKKADLETVLNDLAAGQYTKPSQIVAFNTAEGWSKDVTLDVALELLHRAERGNTFLGEIAQRFVELNTGRTVPELSRS